MWIYQLEVAVVIGLIFIAAFEIATREKRASHRRYQQECRDRDKEHRETRILNHQRLHAWKVHRLLKEQAEQDKRDKENGLWP